MIQRILKNSIYNVYVIIKNFFMNDFWNNVSRYPRFFISSLIGLILVILSPFRNLFKIPRLRLVLIPSIVLLIALFSWIIKTMVGL